jgi:hypothetical protein
MVEIDRKANMPTLVLREVVAVDASVSSPIVEVAVEPINHP